ncbi:MAG: hypothetical protein AAFY60_16925, partial [Myxococcota bacterium]
MSISEKSHSFSCFVVVLVGACSSGDNNPTDVTPGGSNNNNTPVSLSDPNAGRTPTAPYDQISWGCQDIQVDNPGNPAGVQGRLLFGAGNLYYAFLKRAEPVPECTNAISGQVSPAPKFDLYLATGAPDGALTNEIINLVGAVDDPGFVSDAFGIGAAVNGSGQPVLSVAAGGEGLFTCGSSDLVVIERTGANAFDIDAPSTDSADFSTLCTDLATANAGEVECCVDPACGSGTNVGPWSDVAISGGNTAVVFTDYHNFADQDGQTHQGVELWENNGGVSGVRPWSGLGQYASAEFAQDGSLIVAYTGYVGDGLF